MVGAGSWAAAVPLSVSLHEKQGDEDYENFLILILLCFLLSFLIIYYTFLIQISTYNAIVYAFLTCMMHLQAYPLLCLHRLLLLYRRFVYENNKLNRKSLREFF